MIRCGALDAFDDNRATLMHHLPRALQTAEQHHRNHDTGQNDMFGGGQIVARAGVLEKNLNGMRILCWRLNAKPWAFIFQVIRSINTAMNWSVLSVKPCAERLAQPIAAVENNHRDKDANRVKVGGLLIDMRLRNSPSGRIAFLTLDDNTERIQCGGIC